MRADGRPSGSTVASVIAVALRPLRPASSSQAAASGSGSSGSGSGSAGRMRRAYPNGRSRVDSLGMTDLATVRQWIGAAERIVALTGAGISTESGIPDFRGPQGLWTRNPEAEKMATLQHYVADPDVRKRAWKNRVQMLGRDPKPNAGHHALVALERRGALHTLVTQNVDGLHQLAGSSPGIVVEIHGTMREVVCLDCGERAPTERGLGG